MTQEEAFEKLDISVDLIPAGSSNRPGTRLRPTFVTIHNTGNASPGANAAMHARYVKGADARARRVSWHFTVDDKRVFKHLPTNEVAWHAGPGNSRSIAIEVCENRGIDTAAAIDRAALLTALMMLAYGIGRDGVVTHQKWTGKDCPRVILRRKGGFEAFRDRAAAYLDELRPPLDEAAESAAAPDETVESPDLAMLADQDEATATDTPPTSDGDRVALLERLVVRLTVENQVLREALEAAEGAARESEYEAD
jgi:N-acetylmuramoyl-L-alanine amidase CwlA